MTAALTNGAKPAIDLDGSGWLRSPVSQFFTHFNWDNHSLEVQATKRAQTDDAPLSLTLSVRHFFDSIAWDGSATAPAPPELPSPAQPSDNKFTLDDFSNLF